MKDKEPAPAPRSPWGRIWVALATGIGIVALAYASKRVLGQPIRPLFLAIPPLLMSAYEFVSHRRAGEAVARPGYWVVGILAVTVLIVAAHLI